MTDAAAANVEPVEFNCTEADFLDAQRLHHTLSLKGRRFLITIVAGALILAVVVMIGQRGPGLETGEDAAVGVAIFLGFMAVWILLNRLFLLPRAARRQLSQLKEFKGPLKVGIRSPRIVITTKNGVSEVPTEDFLKWAENRKSILLYRSDRQFNFVPKRAISAAFRENLVAELARAGVPQARFSNS